jgi:hypothetical protein
MISVTALVITYNEAPNIRRTLEKLSWTTEIVVVDSGSSDETLAIVAEFTNTRVVTRSFDSFAQQCNFGLSQVKTEWVLSIDADYVLTSALATEIQGLEPDDGIAGYRAAFQYCIHGRPLRSTLYPARAVLYRTKLAQYRNDGHGHKVEIAGKIEALQGKIQHDDRKPLSRWLASQTKYAAQEAQKLHGGSSREGGMADQLRRKIWPAVPAVFFYTYFVKRLFLDGWAGLHYTLQRTYAELLLSLELLELKLKR